MAAAECRAASPVVQAQPTAPGQVLMVAAVQLPRRPSRWSAIAGIADLRRRPMAAAPDSGSRAATTTGRCSRRRYRHGRYWRFHGGRVVLVGGPGSGATFGARQKALAAMEMAAWAGAPGIPPMLPGAWPRLATLAAIGAAASTGAPAVAIKLPPPTTPGAFGGGAVAGGSR